ncbi:hypothetical protein GGI12_002653 [Dipsacomyces acuminosporus]|nr:hypothetical protein GGI12_002653 [Dipsacomyces acuminosporus]
MEDRQALSWLPAEVLVGAAVGSFLFNVLFHSIRYQGTLTTEKQLAWVLTFTTCVVVTTGSIPYVVTALRNGLDVSKLVYTDVFSNLLLGFFLAYLVWDLALGMVYYRSTITILTGYIHHTLYICILLYAAAQGVSAIFAMLCYNELPTIILALGHINKEWRSELAFATTFFATRIALHLVFMIKFFKYSELRFLWKLMLLVFPMHLYWFYGAIRQQVRRYKDKQAPMHGSLADDQQAAKLANPGIVDTCGMVAVDGQEHEPLLSSITTSYSSTPLSSPPQQSSPHTCCAVSDSIQELAPAILVSPSNA